MTKRQNPTPSRGFAWTDEDQLFLQEFFQVILKAPGHYCRQDSGRTYLSSLVPIMNKLHNVYLGRCRASRKYHFSIFKFTEYFKENNFSLFKRKKDWCNTCWNEAFALTEKDKLSADNWTIFVITALWNNANILLGIKLSLVRK